MADEKPIIELDRHLVRDDPRPEDSKVIEQSDIPPLDKPIVILGDPGMGKSILTQALGRLDGYRYVRAATLVRNANPEKMLGEGQCLVIDGLDEVASATVSGGVDAVLTQLSKMGYPPFILSSREVDWRGATDRIKIEDDYGHAATLLHLLPFDADNATIYLACNFPTVDTAEILRHLAERGLDDIYKNPLTLRLIGEVAASENTLPNSRAELLERACLLLVKEENPRHQDAAHARAEAERLLLAAGAHAAAQLLCDLAGTFNGAPGQTPDNYAHVSAIAALPHAGAAEVVLHTRLFEAEGDHRFRLLHRVIAEYLGARWLAACFRSGVSARRLFALFGQGHGVPTSLRGLHAWIGHFDDSLAEHRIAADPYAVLRYGDAETMPVTLARRLLTALAALSDRDPYFRAEDWGRHPASGLMKVELKDDILELIGTPEQHTHLTMLLVEAMLGTPLAPVLQTELSAMMFDTKRYFAERMRAAEALHDVGAITDPEATVERLLAQGGEDDRTLAWQLITDLGLTAVSMSLAVRTLYARIGLTVSDVVPSEDRLNLAHLTDAKVEALDVAQLCDLLDHAQAYGESLIEEANHSARAQVTDLVQLASVRALQLDAAMPPADIWRRLHWVDHNQAYQRETTVALTNWFKDHPVVRRRVQTHVIFDAGYDNVRDATFGFYETGLDLYPDETEIIALIEEFDRRRAGQPADLSTLEELVMLAPRRDGVSAAVCAAAAKVAEGSTAFAAKLEEWAKPLVFAYEQQQEEAARKAAAKRAAVHQTFRDDLSAKLSAVADGARHLLYEPAKAYLGRFSDFDKGAPPQTRVRAFLGDALGDQVLEGFMASLDRNDRPSASAIAKQHTEGGPFYAELPLVCGVAERLRCGLGIVDMSVEARESAFMAWRRTTYSQIAGGMDLAALESAVLHDDAAIERFFRASIEPQLEAKMAHVYDLHFLAHDARWGALAGRLTIEWLQRFPALPAPIESELLACATRHAETDALRALARDTRSRVHRDYEPMLMWLSLDFLIDFDACQADLAAAAAEDRDFLWYIRNRYSGERNDVDRPLSIAQRRFVIEQFSAAWPHTSRPEGSSSGDTNPWDASSAIENNGYAIGDPSADATNALEQLIAIADPSYVDALRHALALQLRLRRDATYQPVPLAMLTSVANSALPTTIDDMRAFFGDRMATLQARMHSTNTDIWEAYWNGSTPRTENFCRNRLIEHISGQLPEAVRFEPEMHMPLQKRADIAAILGSIGLPVEIKRQWHPEVWKAPVEQLAARYVHEWHAEGRGVYIVIWFGDVPGRAMPAPPHGLPKPQTAAEMRQVLIDLLPEALRDVIDVYVVDVSRPPGAKNA
jgi:hypothetical protein